MNYEQTHMHVGYGNVRKGRSVGSLMNISRIVLHHGAEYEVTHSFSNSKVKINEINRINGPNEVECNLFEERCIYNLPLALSLIPNW